MLQPVIVLMVGLAGSGKSNAARRLAAVLARTGRQVSIIGADRHIEAVARRQGKTYNDVHRQAYPTARQDALDDARQLADHGISVIWDATHLTRSIRRRHLDVFKGRGYLKIAACMPPSRDRALARNAARPPGRRIPQTVIERSAAIYQPPQQTEGFDMIVEPGDDAASHRKNTTTP